MKEITNRQEFGKKVNFGECPVVKIDLNQKAFGDVLFKGDKVRVDFGRFNTGERFLAGGEILYNIEENKIEVANYGVCLSSRFSYEDAMEKVEYGQAPIINDGDEVVIIIHNSLTKDFHAYVATAKRGDRNCSTMMTFE
jgi:hypothetical protein